MLTSIPMKQYLMEESLAFLRPHLLWLNAINSSDKQRVYLCWGSDISLLSPSNQSMRLEMTSLLQLENGFVGYVSSFDHDHILVLSYSSNLSPSSSSPLLSVDLSTIELSIINSVHGTIFASQIISLPTQSPLHYPPIICSTYSIASRKFNFLKWHITNGRRSRGGYRNLPPVLTIIDATDQTSTFLKVKDTEDIVIDLLEAKEFNAALDLALTDKTSFRTIDLSLVVDRYLNYLFDDMDSMSPTPNSEQGS